jgi:hypothetical protein
MARHARPARVAHLDPLFAPALAAPSAPSFDRGIAARIARARFVARASGSARLWASTATGAGLSAGSASARRARRHTPATDIDRSARARGDAAGGVRPRVATGDIGARARISLRIEEARGRHQTAVKRENTKAHRQNTRSMQERGQRLADRKTTLILGQPGAAERATARSPR